MTHVTMRTLDRPSSSTAPAPWRSGRAALVAALALLATAAPAAAQNAADKAAAEQLFKEARTLMGAKQYAEACPKLEASLRLDPALGTRLNLASCYEESGKLASAWGMYHEAADLALNENQPKRVKFAQDHAKALEPRLPKLIITVAAASSGLPGLRVTRDGTVIDAALFGTSIYVDPGSRAIAAEAPGHKPFALEVIALEGKETKVEVPALVAEPKPEPAVVAPQEARVEVPAGVVASFEDPGKTRRLAGLIAGASGVVAAGVGLGFGLSARSKWNEANDGLCTDNVCTPEGQELADSARSRATVSTVMVSAGAALIVTGAVLYFTAPRREASSRSARLLPTGSASAAGVALVGRF